MLNELAKRHGGSTKLLGGTFDLVAQYKSYEVDWNNKAGFQPGDILVGVNDDQSHGVDRHVVMYVGNGTICHAGSPLKFGPMEDQWNRFNKMDQHAAVRILACKDIYKTVPTEWQSKVF